MNGYERIIGLIQQPKGSSIVFTGIMNSETTCTINELQLDSEDLLIAHHLKTGWCRQTGSNMEFIEPLKAGDSVLVIKVNEEIYVVAERLVSV